MEAKFVDVEKQKGRRLSWDSKVTGNCMGTKAAAVPSLAPGAGVGGCCRSFGGKPVS